jgi:TRAP-type C4-dicarboxylate transport system substrate-binding protein
MNPLRKSLLAIAVALAAGTAASMAGAQTVEWKLSHWLPPTHPLQKIYTDWAKAVEKDSGGTMKIAVFPAQQLGKAPDHYDMVIKGIAEVGYISTGYQAGRMLVSNAGQLPFLMSNADGGSAAFDEWYRPYSAKDMPGVKMCFMFAHDVASLHSKKEIRTPDQIKGMKIRPAHATMARWMNTLGGTTVQVSAPEAREALERGVADAITFPWGSLMSFKIDGITKFHIDAPMYVATFATIINTDKYEALTPAQKKAVDAHCNTETARKVGAEWAIWEDAGRQKLKAPGSGHTITTLKPEELAAWKKSSEVVYQQWVDDVTKTGLDGNKVLGELKSALARYNALAQ